MQLHFEDLPPVEPCPCGNPHPTVDAEEYVVQCGICLRRTGGYGVVSAINFWNQRIASHKEGSQQFEAPAFLPSIKSAKDAIESLKKAAAYASGKLLPQPLFADDLNRIIGELEAAIQADEQRRKSSNHLDKPNGGM